MPKALLLVSALLLIGLGCSPTHQATEEHDEEEQEWISLFNGQDLDDWIVKINHHDVDENWENTFRVEDGMIRVGYEGYGDFDDQFGHLYYKQPFSYYHLVVEYRFVGEQQPGAPSWALRNSGVMLHAQDPRTITRDQAWPFCIETQFLGGLSDGEPRSTGNLCTPGTNVVYKGQFDTTHCIASTSETYDGDQWVRAEVIVLGDSLITHIVEGDTVLQYSQPQIGGGAVDNYDPAVIPSDGTPVSAGYIALQSEGHPIDFRRVELLNLAGCMDPEASNYKSYFVKPDPGLCQY